MKRIRCLTITALVALTLGVTGCKDWGVNPCCYTPDAWITAKNLDERHDYVVRILEDTGGQWEPFEARLGLVPRFTEVTQMLPAGRYGVLFSSPSKPYSNELRIVVEVAGGDHKVATYDGLNKRVSYR